MLIALIGLVASLSAQDFTKSSVGVFNLVSDTIDDTEANDTTVLLKVPRGHPWGISVQLVATTISGTMDIDIAYQGSNDGSNYTTISTDSLATGDVSDLFNDEGGFPYRYFRVLRTGVGTQSTTMTGYMYLFRVPGD